MRALQQYFKGVLRTKT